MFTVRDAVELDAKNLQRSALLGHVVVPVIVTRLHASEPVRLQVSTDLAADAFRCEQRLDARTNPLQLESVDRGADDVVSPACQRPATDRLLAGGGRDDELSISSKLRQRLRHPGDQRQLMRPRSLARSTLVVEDGDRAFGHFSPPKAQELLDALPTREEVQAQRSRFDSRHRLDQPPIRSQLVRRQRVLVRSIELWRTFGLRGRIEDDREGLESDRDRCRGSYVDCALIRGSQVRPQFVRRSALVGSDQPAQHVEHVIRGHVGSGRFGQVWPRFDHLQLKQPIRISVASPPHAR